MIDRSRRHIIALGLFLGLAGLAGTAQPLAAWSGPPIAGVVVERLEAEGYGVVETRRSWFGRIVILATRDGMLREIVLNRTTGAVLSDRVFAVAPGAGTSGMGSGAAGPSGPPSPTDGSGKSDTRPQADGGNGGG